MRWLALACALLSPSLAAAEKFGVGVRATSFARGEENEGNPLVFRGGGVQVRWRPFTHWSLELAFDGLRAESEGGAISATSVPMLLAARFHLFTRPQWDCYLLFGAGGATTKVSFRTADGTMREEEFSEAQVHLGAGLEYRFGRLGLGTEIRAVGVGTDEQAKTFRGPPGDDEGGVQFHVTATYYLF